MSSIDEAITKGKRRRKVLAIISVVAVIMLGVTYFGWLFLTKGYSFSITPKQAAETSVISLQQGKGFVIGDKLYMVGDEASVVVSATLYQAETVNVNSTSPSTIDVELTPLPATVHITTSPALEDVAWTVNGAKTSQLGQLNMEFPPGPYTITATHPSYESGSITINAEIAAKINENIVLVPIEGEIAIKSSPSGAAVSINGEAVGVTPLKLNSKGGNHAVSITQSGYEPIEDTVSVTKARPNPARNYTLKPLQSRLSVSLNPQGGVLTVDGKPFSNTVSVDADVKHTVKYEKAGYITQSQTLTLSPGEEQALNFSLSSEMGVVQINASVPADVFINGVNKGQAPLTLTLQALPTAVELRYEGYRTVQKTIRPKRQSATTVNADMLTEFDARRRDGQPLFVSTLGIQLTRLSPEKLTMGSPANEKGRQRNEHQVDVSFDRDIWVSRHEITEAQFNASTGKGGGSHAPATNMTWDEAAIYTNWLSEKEALPPFYIVRNHRVTGINKNATGYRLPTEAEWEYVAKANRRSAPTTFVWGNQQRVSDKQGNFADSSLKGKQTFVLDNYEDGFAGKAPVGSFKADRGGFYDMDGNVREWVHDFYSNTPPDLSFTHQDYLGVPSGSEHVVKGASFKTGRIKNIRASVRTGMSEGADDIGFRIARYNK